MSHVLVLQHDAKQLPLRDRSVQMVCTSPPYFNLRDYGTGTWIGGDEACTHSRQTSVHDASVGTESHPANVNHALEPWKGGACGRCGAVRQDKQLGMEQLHDCLGWATGIRCGSCYVCVMVDVFREVRRVLRDDGTVFLNLGDSFTSGGRVGHGTRAGYKQETNRGMNGSTDPVRAPQPVGLQPKNLLGMPWRVALALQADGWILRSDIIWNKVNGFPESVTDRPTKVHEYVFLLTKQPRYFWDQEAVREPHDGQSGWAKQRQKGIDTWKYGRTAGGNTTNGIGSTFEHPHGRNLRSVWSISTESFSGEHYASFPTALVERCIRAGSPESCCGSCGAPWKRDVEHGAYTKLSTRGTQPFTQGVGGKRQDSRGGLPLRSRTSTGFVPSCACDADPVPSIVLDPFLGSGTVALVARQLGRHGVGGDLSWPYLQIARDRLGLTALDAWEGTRLPVPESDPAAGLPLFEGI